MNDRGAGLGFAADIAVYYSKKREKSRAMSDQTHREKNMKNVKILKERRNKIMKSK